MSARSDKAPRHTRARESKRFRHRLGGRFVLATREAAQHRAEQPDVVRAGRLELRVGRQRYLVLRPAIADAGHGDWDFLIRGIWYSAGNDWPKVDLWSAR